MSINITTALSMSDEEFAQMARTATINAAHAKGMTVAERQGFAMETGAVVLDTDANGSIVTRVITNALGQIEMTLTNGLMRIVDPCDFVIVFSA